MWSGAFPGRRRLRVPRSQPRRTRLYEIESRCLLHLVLQMATPNPEAQGYFMKFSPIGWHGRWAVLSVLGLSWGCTVGSDYRPPQMQLPAKFLEASTTQPTSGPA